MMNINFYKMSKAHKKHASKKASASKRAVAAKRVNASIKTSISKGAHVPKKPDTKGAAYLGLAFQMGIVILLGALGGRQLDKMVGGRYPIFTIVFSLLAIALAMYYVIHKELNKHKKKKNE
jgi:F0F1-type ATP synthase assembly protein I